MRFVFGFVLAGALVALVMAGSLIWWGCLAVVRGDKSLALGVFSLACCLVVRFLWGAGVALRCRFLA